MASRRRRCRRSRTRAAQHRRRWLLTGHTGCRPTCPRCFPSAPIRPRTSRGGTHHHSPPLDPPRVVGPPRQPTRPGAPPSGLTSAATNEPRREGGGPVSPRARASEASASYAVLLLFAAAFLAGAFLAVLVLAAALAAFLAGAFAALAGASAALAAFAGAAFLAGAFAALADFAAVIGVGVTGSCSTSAAPPVAGGLGPLDGCPQRGHQVDRARTAPPRPPAEPRSPCRRPWRRSPAAAPPGSRRCTPRA